MFLPILLRPTVHCTSSGPTLPQPRSPRGSPRECPWDCDTFSLTRPASASAYGRGFPVGLGSSVTWGLSRVLSPQDVPVPPPPPPPQPKRQMRLIIFVKGKWMVVGEYTFVLALVFIECSLLLGTFCSSCWIPFVFCLNLFIFFLWIWQRWI